MRCCRERHKGRAAAHDYQELDDEVFHDVSPHCRIRREHNRSLSHRRLILLLPMMGHFARQSSE
jgi:hypothetical protein